MRSGHSIFDKRSVNIMIERLIIKIRIIFGILSFPTLFKKPSVKIWLPLFLINCLIIWIFDKVLVETKQVKYPIRFITKNFKINVVYDFLVCSFVPKFLLLRTQINRILIYFEKGCAMG